MAMPKFVVRQSLDVKKFMRVNGKGLEWVDDPALANPYPSRYAAKRALERVPFDVSADRVIEEYVQK